MLLSSQKPRIATKTTSIFSFCAFLLLCTTTLPSYFPSSEAFSTPSNKFDRFRASCPADKSCIQKFDPSLQINAEDEEVWVAVYRSSNNLPSVILKDDFMNAMKIATTNAVSPEITIGNNSNNNENESNSEDEGEGKGVIQEQSPPIAIARLAKSTLDGNKFMIDTLRCVLKKEKTDTECDGGSEHKEALSVCLDELILHYLKEKVSLSSDNEEEDEDEEEGNEKYECKYESILRCKATLVSGPLLEMRGFQEVEEVGMDFATHSSNLEGSMLKYAERVASSVSLSGIDENNSGLNDNSAKTPNARNRALEILSKLSLLDPEREKQAAFDDASSNSDSGDDNDIDPWSSIKQFYN